MNKYNNIYNNIYNNNIKDDINIFLKNKGNY